MIRGKIVRTFERGGVSGKVVNTAIDKMIARVQSELPQLADEVSAAHPSEIYHDIIRGIHTRIGCLQAGA